MTLKSRRRGAALEDAILEAAWDVLIDNGYPGFTYDAVAARAGTSRPVLSRRWPQRDDLVVAAIAAYRRRHRVDVPDTGSLREDALGLLRALNADRIQMVTVAGVQLMGFFRGAGTSMNDLRASLIGPDEPQPFEVLVARAVARGELPDVPRSAVVVNMPFDLLRHDLIMTMRVIPDEKLVAIVDEAWLPLLTR
ncbi:TetR/AcrR family transcriptional regulator [Actinoplanes rectilineatus]|uniref:TetR/AcrR family transcriptional regulator n=1 Tax=Actinoplanes rectilineatus TaxID=113571 RepID=UPI0005F2B754|nr:TetR/AcrR family transcriptional regulator [Actinoplanes rectilineatus]